MNDLAPRGAEGDGVASGAPLTLLVRAYCSLCEDMHARATMAATAAGRPLHLIDVDADSALEAAWGEAVPVLFLGAPAPGHELCRHRWDARRVNAALGPAVAA